MKHSAFVIYFIIFATYVHGQKNKPISKNGNPSTKTSVTKSNKETIVEITTDFGVMHARLYNSTPKHRDNFIQLVQKGFYDSLLFHRVIEKFVVQGGDPNSKTADSTTILGAGNAPGNRIPAEFIPELFHKKGALAAARDNNPEKSSSNVQFYIVQGDLYDNDKLQEVYLQRILPVNPSFKYSEYQKEVYKRIGGTPFLDQNYTVFGEVSSGLNVIDKIAAQPKNNKDRPLQNIRMKIRLLN